MSKEKKNWTGNNKSIYSTLGASSHSEYERAQQDYYATEPSAIDDLFAVEEFGFNIWEPACGEGHLSKRMEELGKDVYSTDIVDRGYGDAVVDFLNVDVKDVKCDIITNPPYRYAKEFVEKAIDVVEEGQKVAMFLKIQFLESEKRKDLFKNNPPKRVYVYSKRKTCALNGDEEMFNKSSAVCYAWFVWETGFTGDPLIKWI